MPDDEWWNQAVAQFGIDAPLDTTREPPTGSTLGFPPPSPDEVARALPTMPTISRVAPATLMCLPTMSAPL